MINEESLKIIVNSLRALEVGVRARADEISHIKHVMARLQLIDSEMPKDTETGEPISDARRQEIYDRCLPLANKLLGFGTDRLNDDDSQPPA